MKHFIIIKTGYSSGVYGCTAEYFTLIIYDPSHSWVLVPHYFYGMYGVEHRIAEYLHQAGLKGYSGAYSADFGKVPYREKRGLNEHAMIEELKKLYPTLEKGATE